MRSFLKEESYKQGREGERRFGQTEGKWVRKVF